MSLYNVLRTGTSGMDAQSTKLATVADNIANANTVGYKRAGTEFVSLMHDAGPSGYSSGAVATEIRHRISEQGALKYTSSGTDLAIEGNGFFVVRGAEGADVLTRSGSFVLDDDTGTLVNAAGFTLLGFPGTGDATTGVTLNDAAGLEPIDVTAMHMRATPSTEGLYHVNLDSDEVALAAPTAGANVAGASFSVKNSVVTYDDLGSEVTLDLYWSKVQDMDPASGDQAVWEVVVYDRAQADPAADENFPYSVPDVPHNGTALADQPFLARAQVQFDNSGAIDQIITDPLSYDGGATVVPGDTVAVNGADPNAQAVLSVALPNASSPVALNITGTTQLASAFEPLEVAVNGHPPSTVDEVAIRSDGTVSAVYKDGSEVAFYRLPLANVPSPDQLEPLAGNVFAPTAASGGYTVGLPDTSGNGSLVVGAVEQSNVDLADELTDMIITQRAFTANSKSFQTGNELLDVLINLKR